MNQNLTLINFNAMSLLSFDTFQGMLSSRNILSRMKKLAEILKKENTDIIALQEIHTYLALNMLRKQLPEHPYIAYKRFLYGPRGGLVIFSKYPLDDITYINFEKRGSFRNLSFVGHVIRNGILSCRLKDTSVRLLDTHLIPNMDGEWIQTNRYCIYIEAQLLQVAQLVKKLAKKESIILAGDFNTAKDSYLYEQFMKQSGVKDVFEAFTFPTQHPEYLPKDKQVKRIDYIFVRDKHSSATIVTAEHLFTKKFLLKKNRSSYISDHVGLRAELALPLSSRT